MKRFKQTISLAVTLFSCCYYADAQGLNIEQARKIFELPVHCIKVEFPNKPGETLGSAAELKRPKELRPIFYGCFDWHSSVHGYWSIVRLLKEFPELDAQDSVRSFLNAVITAENVAVEKSFFEDYNNRNFERTYGWAWFLTLQSELSRWQDEDGQRWRMTLKPLEDLLVSKYIAYLPKLVYPIRTGTHDNTAFGLSLAIDYAQVIGNKEFEEIIKEQAKRLYFNDKNAPLSFEPSGNDFLSPSLEEALLMSKTLNDSDFELWLKDFLPALFSPSFVLKPGIVSDRSDGQLVHLDGLNFSRASCFYGIARKLPSLQHLRTAGDEHFDYSFKNITNDDYMGSHWLGTFALRAISDR